MKNKKPIRILAGVFLLGLVIYLAIPYRPSLAEIEQLSLSIDSQKGWYDPEPQENKELYDILSRIRVQKISLYFFPDRFYGQDYYAIFVSGNSSYHLIEFFPHGDSMNGRQPYGYIKKIWGPNAAFESKQLIANFDEFVEELTAHGFL